MKKQMKAIAKILAASQVTYQPVTAPERKCRAIFLAAAHFHFVAATSEAERRVLNYDPHDWNELYEPGKCPTLSDARKAGVQAACALLT